MFKFEQFRLRLHAELEDHKNRILRELSGVDRATLTKLRKLVNDSYDVKAEIHNLKIIAKEMENIMATIAELTARLNTVNNSLTSLEFNTNSELDAINAKITTLNDKLENLGSIESVDTTALDEEITAMERKVASMESSTETNMASINEKLDEMETKIDELNEGESYTVDFTMYAYPAENDPELAEYYSNYDHRIDVDGQTYSISAKGGNKETIANAKTVKIKVDGSDTRGGGFVKYSTSAGETTLTVDDMDATGWKTIILTSNLTIVEVGCYTCLTGDTLITMSDGSEKRIDSIVVGDKVLALDPETLDYVEDEVLVADASETNNANEYDVWGFSDGSIVKTVHRHRLYNIEKQAMVYMDEWKIGDHAFDKDGNYVELISHETVKEKVKHYTIFTEKQNYFANGLLAGNRHTKPMSL